MEQSSHKKANISTNNNTNINHQQTFSKLVPLRNYIILQTTKTDKHNY